MGRSKHIFSDAEKNQLQMELYCSSCKVSLYNDSLAVSKMTQNFDRHCKTKKHKSNVERYRLELENELIKNNLNQKSTEIKDNDSKIEPFIDNLNDDHMTSVSEVILNSKITKTVNDLSDKCSSINSNYYDLTSKVHKVIDTQVDFEDKVHNFEDKVMAEIDKLKKIFNKSKVSFKNDNNDNNDNNNNVLTLLRLVFNQYEILMCNNSINDSHIKELSDICLRSMKLCDPTKEPDIWRLLLDQCELFDNNNYEEVKQKMKNICSKLFRLLT